MSKHKYCCQNTTQNFLDHIIPVPDDLKVNPDFLCGLCENDFIKGLKALTETFKNIYADIVQNPAEYGLPLVDDIEYSPFNPKAAESKNSSHRLFALLHTLAQSGELAGGEINVNDNNFNATIKKLKSIHKISNSKMIFKKLRDFGFIYENNILSYPDDENMIPVMYGYMKNVALNHNAAFSLNCFLAAHDVPSHQAVFTEYLSGGEREFFKLLNEFTANENFVVGDAPDYRAFSFSIEYLVDSKTEKRVMRCYSDFGKLRVNLKLHNSGSYIEQIEKMPENVKQIFRKESTCRFCKESCRMRLHRTFEGIEYTDCGYWNGFDIICYEPSEIEYYKQIILLEVKAAKSKTNI